MDPATHSNTDEQNMPRISDGVGGKHLDTEVLIVGAGFGGLYCLLKLRDELGFRCKIYEASGDLGGNHQWNSYPGARSEASAHMYEYSIEKVWRHWTWTEKYPKYQELRRYLEYVDQTLDVKKDVAFNAKVISSDFDPDTNTWMVKTEDGRTARCKYLILAAGFAAEPRYPDWPGLDAFAGTIHHAASWPDTEVDVTGKRVAVVGTGAAGVQIIQEYAPLVAQLMVLQRTPNLALPMRQKQLTPEDQDAEKPSYPDMFRHRRTTFSGFDFGFAQKTTLDDTPEEREAYFEQQWQKGGQEFLLSGYADMFSNEAANREAYRFWAKKTRARITDPVKRDILVPLDPPYALGTKQPTLEQNYYEKLNEKHVRVVDIKANPVVEVKSDGIVTSDGAFHGVDVVVLATGFDTAAAGHQNFKLKDLAGTDLAEKWKTGLRSYLGMMCNGCPNLFYLNAARATTGYSNGLSTIEAQGDWIAKAIDMLREQSIGSIQPSREADESWEKIVSSLRDESLFRGTDSWYVGIGLSRKQPEEVGNATRLSLYDEAYREALDGWKGFEVVKKGGDREAVVADSTLETEKTGAVQDLANHDGGSVVIDFGMKAMSESQKDGLVEGSPVKWMDRDKVTSKPHGATEGDDLTKPKSEANIHGTTGLARPVESKSETRSRPRTHGRADGPRVARRKSRWSVMGWTGFATKNSDEGKQEWLKLKDIQEEKESKSNSMEEFVPIIRRQTETAVPQSAEKPPQPNLERSKTVDWGKSGGNDTAIAGSQPSKPEAGKLERRKSRWAKIFGGKKSSSKTEGKTVSPVRTSPPPPIPTMLFAAPRRDSPKPELARIEIPPPSFGHVGSSPHQLLSSSSSPARNSSPPPLDDSRADDPQTATSPTTPLRFAFADLGLAKVGHGVGVGGAVKGGKPEVRHANLFVVGTAGREGAANLQTDYNEDWLSW